MLLDEGREFPATVLILQLLHLNRVLLHQIGACCLNMLQKVVVVVLHEIDSRLLVLLNLLQNRPVLVFHVEMRLIQFIDTLLVVLESDLQFVFSFETLIHHFMHFLHSSVSLLLAEQRFLDFDF